MTDRNKTVLPTLSDKNFFLSLIHTAWDVDWATVSDSLNFSVLLI